MASEKSPAFQFYVKEWRSSRAVMRMTFAQRGMYLEMLLEQWEHFSLPDDPAAVAEIIGGSVAEWTDAWPTLRRKFVDRRTRARGDEHDDNNPYKRIINAKLEEIRKGLKRFVGVARKGGLARSKSAKRGKNGTYYPAGTPAGEPAETPAGTPAVIQPPTSTPTPTASASPTASAIAIASPSATAVRPRGGPPLAMGLRRFKVWRWMLDDFIERLGARADDFGLDAWLQALDQRDAAMVPRDSWIWLQSEFLAECRRRGLEIAVVVADAPTNKRIAGLVAGGQAFLNRGAR